jgi:DNA-binding response OmpR family regulator
MMPEMDGLEVLGAMKADEAMASIPVIILSAKFQSEEIQEGLRAGADGYLVKPFQTPDLRQAMESLLSRRGTELEQQAPLESRKKVK